MEPANVPSTPSGGGGMEINLNHNLNLAPIGNCTFNALIDTQACITWCCFPRLDGDPIFCNLVRRTKDLGFFDVVMESFESADQEYIKNTAILRTTLTAKTNTLEVVDFAPRFKSFGRRYQPTMLIRILNPIRGRPRARVRLRPTFGYGWGTPEKTRGSNHIRYLLPHMTLRLTTNAPIAYILDEVLFEIEEPIYLVLMPDESLTELVLSHLENTKSYWQDWVRTLTIPYDYQAAVIRAAITVKLAAFADTGAIIAAPTTSIPSHPNGELHDMRYCWLRDGFITANTLNKLGASADKEHFLKFISNIVANIYGDTTRLQPVYGIALETRIHPREMHRLHGYRGCGPVHAGSGDYNRIVNDTYGSLVLSLTQVFFDERLLSPGDDVLFRRLEELGKEALRCYHRPDSGSYSSSKADNELRVHTFSVVMCWVACDRLAKIAQKLELVAPLKMWTDAANEVREFIMANCWSPEMNSFIDIVGMKTVDMYLLLLPRLGFIAAKDAKFISTVAAIETHLRKGWYVLRSMNDQSASTSATLFYVTALYSIGRHAEAREVFDHLLKNASSPLGFLSENVSLETNELWGNFPYTPAMAEAINAAMEISRHWNDEL